MVGGGAERADLHPTATRAGLATASGVVQFPALSARPI